MTIQVTRIAAVAAALLVGGCVGDFRPDNDGDGKPDSDELEGAGGRSIIEYWPSIAVPLSDNVKMLAFDMIRNEVQRATGRSWIVGGVDQWERNRAALGGADYVSTFIEDTTPSQQKMVLLRKMAYQVGQDAVDGEAGAATRPLFTEIDPGATFATSDPVVAAQVRSLFRRFFLEAPSDVEVTEALTLLGDLAADTGDPKQAWRGLIVSYLASLRFLTY